MPDRFSGAWRVTEYVYNPDGSFVGIVHQRRTLSPLENGRLRVHQVCTVAPAITAAGHPMSAFAGEWTFEMSREGARRLYHGIDVVGEGFMREDGAILGAGRWTRFGYDFLSFAIMTSPTRQITGGIFHSGDLWQPMARIVGVGIAEGAEADEAWGALAQEHPPHASDETRSAAFGCARITERTGSIHWAIYDALTDKEYHLDHPPHEDNSLMGNGAKRGETG